MRNKALLRVAITGPESSGKTTLARALAEHFQTVWVPEYARVYLEELARPYRMEDLDEIARGQLRWEEEYGQKADGYLFCDTDLLVLKVWSEYKYGQCSPFLLQALRENPYDLHVLCAPDIPWEYDPLRENPGDRRSLFQIYSKELSLLKASFLEVSGGQRPRLEKVVDFLQARWIL